MSDQGGANSTANDSPPAGTTAAASGSCGRRSNQNSGSGDSGRGGNRGHNRFNREHGQVLTSSQKDFFDMTPDVGGF